jgi:hypothetical protein
LDDTPLVIHGGDELPATGRRFLSDGIIPSEEAMLADPQVYTIHDEPEL